MLQYAYQPNASKTMASWATLEIIGYYHRNGSSVYGCLTDMLKAFDLVKDSVLFKKLRARKLPPIIIRTMMVIYMKQVANVTWNNSFSKMFRLANEGDDRNRIKNRNSGTQPEFQFWLI